MNTQHDSNTLAKATLKPLKPLLFASCMILVFSQSFADNLSKDMLNELSAEASNTKMDNKQDSSKTTEDPTASLKTDSNEIAGDELSEKIEKQLRRVLGKNSSDDSESTEADKRNTEAELEKIVSSSLLEGARMDDIRSAVDDAMSEIKKDKQSKKAIAPERITEADKAFSKLTVKKTPASKPAEKKPTASTESTSSTSTSSSTSTTAKTSTPTSTSSTSLPKTVTVQNGESLYKIALRLYGDGGQFIKLYEANRDNVPDPNLLLEGQVLTVPR